MSAKQRISIGLWVLSVLFSGLCWAQSSPSVRTEISNLSVAKNSEGKWIASFDYVFEDDGPGAALFAAPGVGKDWNPNELPMPQTGLMPARRGRNHAEIELQRPFSPSALTTRYVTAVLRPMDNRVGPTSQQIEFRIVWPDVTSYQFEQIQGQRSKEDLLDEAVQYIDSGSPPFMDNAKVLLERIIVRDPKYTQAYVEMARLAMRSGGMTRERLKESENLLNSALQIDPTHANARILLGYVYTHQQRYGEAEKLFAEVAKKPNDNLWLWANWGETLLMRGKNDQAMEKYKIAVSKPRPNNTYDRAQLDAYRNLIDLYRAKKDLDSMEALFKRREADYGYMHCQGADYALFLLHDRGQFERALASAREAVKSQCPQQDARGILGLAYYAQWSIDKEADKAASLSQARAFLVMDANALYRLAQSDHTTQVIKQLQGKGEKIDQLDARRMSALAYALSGQDYAAAKRLIALGARPTTPVGPQAMPAALIPVASEDLEGVKLMRRAGVDYATLRFAGMTAIEHARQSGNKPLLEALSGKGQKL